jgi:predicted AAA+ superfamily ATPase
VVFGQMKYNKSYNRFQHADIDKIKMYFAVFAIAFNILKLRRKETKKRKATKNPCKYYKNPF